MKYIVSLFFVVLSVFSVTVSADTISPPPEPFDCVGGSNLGKSIEIVFVNGIRNKVKQAQCSSERLAAIVASREFPLESFDYSYFYNPTAGFFIDYSEMVVQASLSKTASLSTYTVSNDSRYNYYYHLGKLYTEAFASNLHTAEGTKAVYRPAYDLIDGLRKKSETGKKLILVPLSQGNFYVEAAYGVFLYEEHIANQKGKYTDTIRVVGVAPVSSTTPHDKYVRMKEDKAILAFIADTSFDKTFTVLPPTSSACVLYDFGTPDTCYPKETKDLSFFDATIHGFIEIYLNLFVGYRDIPTTGPYATIAQYVQDFLRELTAATATVVWKPSFSVQDLVYGINNAIFFDAESSRGKTPSFTFDFGDGTIKKGERKVSHFYTKKGNYSVRLTTQEAGVISSCSLQLTIEDVLIPPLSLVFKTCE